MSRRRSGSRAALLAALATAAASVMLLGILAAPANATPAWQVHARWGDTNLPPGGKAEFLLYVRNAGTSAGSGTLTIIDQLPTGVSIDKISSVGPYDDVAQYCSGVGTGVLNCAVPASTATTAPLDSSSQSSGGTTVQPAGFLRMIVVDVSVAPNPPVKGVNRALVSGGGGLLVAKDEDPVTFDRSPAVFGLTESSFAMDAFNAEAPFGVPERQAGAHPFEVRVDFDLNQNYAIDSAEGKPYTPPAGRIKTADVTLPRGLIGNPEATPKCDLADFASAGPVGNSTGCPPDTQVGYVNVDFHNTPPDHGNSPPLGPSLLTHVAIYNLAPPKGEVADFGFNAGGYVQGHIYPRLDPGSDYSIKTVSPDISNLVAVRGVQVTFWGVPGDPAHDRYRYTSSPPSKAPALGASFGSAPLRPLLAMPMDCGTPISGSTIRVGSWATLGTLTPPVQAPSFQMGGCDDPRVRFEPAISLQPTNRDAGAPTGLDVHLEVPQRDDVVGDAADLYPQNGDVQAIPIPPIKKAVVTLPEGMTISTSAAQGLGSCSPEQIGLDTSSPVTCPDSSQYGTLTLRSPLLPKDEPMEGSIYIAEQNRNPFNDFIALYLVIQDASRGLLVKLPGRVELDPVTGQVKTSFDDLPQLPVENIELSLKGGVRAALVNPSTCGRKTIAATFYSWADPTRPIVRSSAYAVDRRPDGSPCLDDLGRRPFGPELTAGTVSPSAGSFSPFVFRLTRSDEEQELARLETTLPPGLIAKVAGLGRCSEAQIAEAAAPDRTGRAESLFPSCPATSQIGTTEVGSGVGQVLTYIPGKVYLAGPYRGAPLSMVVLTPILAGPYDLGVIAVRAAIDLDSRNAQISVSTDSFPQIYKGIPVRLRDVQVRIDRPQTTLNPTSCAPMSIQARLTGAGGDIHSPGDDVEVERSSRFQAVNCAALGFRPRLSLRLLGATGRGAHPTLRAVLRARPGDANIGAATVTLPNAAFLDQSHIRTICTRVQYAAQACPRGSVYGYARATTPLLDQPLQGPVYLRSSDNRLPDLVASLNGEIAVEVSSRIDSRGGRIRSTFRGLPDAPVSSFTLTMKGGRKGLLQNSRNLCASVQRAVVKLEGHNGRVADLRPRLGNSCGEKLNAAPKRLDE